MRSVLRVAARRLLLLTLTIAVAGGLSVALIRLAPGYGLDERRLDLRLKPSSIAALAAPTPASYLADLVGGQWGESISLRRPVRELISERARLTATTLATGLAIAWCGAIALGLCGALFRGRVDAAVGLFIAALLCLPAAVVAILSMYSAAGPAIALAIILLPRIARYTRNLLAAATRAPHVLAARARGISAQAIVIRHLGYPAAPELLALAGISVGMAAGAIIPVEALCDSPGLGQLVWQGAMARDLPVLAPLTVLTAAVVCAANLLADAGRALVCRWA